MSGENEFIDWQGGKCPVDPDTIVKVRLSGKDGYFIRRAGDLRWCHTNFSGDIIAYRVVEPPKPEVQIPEGFTPWAGGSECPVTADTEIDVVVRDGSKGSCAAGDLKWTHTGHGNDIVAYRVIEAQKSPSARDTQIGGDHYKTAAVQPWDVVDTWPIEQQIGFHRGNALKYVMRMGTKDENLREIRKAAHYLQKLTEVLEKKGGV